MTFVFQVGLITEVFPKETFKAEVADRLRSMSSFPPKTIREIKNLVRGHEREKLHQVWQKSYLTEDRQAELPSFSHNLVHFANKSAYEPNAVRNSVFACLWRTIVSYGMFLKQIGLPW